MNGPVKLAVVFLLLGQTQTQDANCDFYQNVEVGREYLVRNLRYPANYTPGSRCRWILRCPDSYNCRLDCPTIFMPQSPSCSVDRLLISRTGDTSLSAADYYCGVGTLTGVVSTAQQICIGLMSATISPGGRFDCRVKAQLASNPGPTCSCGYKRSNRIVGGETTKVNEYTMMAGIAYSEVRAIKCGAVIISNRHVLTAAHCVYTRTVNNTAVVVGEHDVTTGSETSASQGFAVQSFRNHERFNDVTYDYDVSIVTVAGTITFNEFVGPVCLPFKFVNSDFAGSKVTMLGWGTDSLGGMTATKLQKVEVDVITQARCQTSYSSLTARQMCTYTPGKDACQDDSGGPLLYMDPQTARLMAVGLISFGRSCAGSSPGVNSRVTALLDWIVSNTDAYLCRVS